VTAGTAQEPRDCWTTTLRRDGFRVAPHDLGTPDEPLRVTRVPAGDVGLCPHGGTPTDAVHRRHASARGTDLPLGTPAVALTLRSYPYGCPHGQRAGTPPAAGRAPGAHAPERFLERAARLSRSRAVAHAAAVRGVPEKTLPRW